MTEVADRPASSLLAAVDDPRGVTPPAQLVDVARPIFVCGVGRSGTSLVHSMLNAHPDVAFPPETHAFRRYVAGRATRAALERGSRAALAARLAGDVDFQRAGVDPQALLTDERDGAIDVARVFARLLAAVAQRQGKSRVGDKDPRSIDHLPALAAAFPAGLLVHVVRDPREVLLSRTRADWSKGRPWWQHALLAEDQLRIGRALGPRLFGPRYLEVRYEQLLAEPEATLRGIAAHVGVAYSPAMLDFGASAASLVDERERAWKKETLGPLLAGNREKWRRELAPARVRFVEAVSHEAFDSVGYSRSEAPAGPLARLGAQAARRAAGIVFFVRRTWEASR